MTGFRTFGPADIRRAVGLPDLIEPMARGFAEFSLGHGQTPIVVFAPAGGVSLLHRGGTAWPMPTAGARCWVLTRTLR
jgi:hypothetical protein